MKVLREHNPHNFNTWLIFQEDDGTQFFTLDLELLQDIKYCPTLTEWLSNGILEPGHVLSFSNKDVVNEVLTMFLNREDEDYTESQKQFVYEQLTTIMNKLFPEYE